MPITLAQAKVGMADKVAQMAIDEFRRGSMLLDQMIFDDSVSPGTGGSTLTYGYTRLKTPANAAFRALNNEYSANEADREKKTVDLAIFGGKFQVDRVIANTSGAVDEMAFQMEQKIKAAVNLFHYTVVNGDTGSDANAFDGLDTILTGSSTEINTDTVIDLSTSANLDSNYKAIIDKLDEFIAEFDGKPSMIMGNSKMITRIKQAARRAGYLTQSEDAFGRKVDAYDGIPLIDLKWYVNDSGTAIPTVPIETRTVDSTEYTGLTDLYAVRLGLDGFHGATVTGNAIMNTYMPDMARPGAVKDGEVEMLAAAVLKATRAAGVLRNIKVQ